MKINPAIFLAVIIFVSFSCSTEPKNLTTIISKVYSENNLAKQTFSIDPDRDTLLIGKSGTVIHIEKNSFADSLGNTVKSPIDIDLKEALNPFDMVLSNLTTTSNGQNLESGGMIYLNATSDGKQLSLSAGKGIDIGIPADSINKNMQVFEGKKDSTGMNWINPAAVANVQPQAPPVAKDSVKTPHKRKTNVAYNVVEIPDGNFPYELDTAISHRIWNGDGLMITKDSAFTIGKYHVRFFKQNKIQESTENFEEEDFGMEEKSAKGSNYFQVDPATNYIFSMKKLGWANIDRLLDDPRTKDVDMIVSIDNQKDFGSVYITMIVPDRKMYLPGYQKADETYSFTHGDFENPKLPVGADAIIMATAYKNDKPFFVLKKIKISEKQNISFHLEETTMDKLKAQLKENI
jgi:hypothetical protein